MCSAGAWANGVPVNMGQAQSGEVVESKKAQSIKLEAVFQDKIVINLDGQRMVYTVGKQGKYGIVFLSSNLQGALMHRNNAYTWLDVNPELQAFYGTQLTPELATEHNINKTEQKAVAKNNHLNKHKKILSKEQKEIKEALVKELEVDQSWLGKRNSINSLYEKQI